MSNTSHVRIRRGMVNDLEMIAHLLETEDDLQITYEEVSSLWHEQSASFLILEQVSSPHSKYGILLGFAVYQKLPRRILLQSIAVSKEVRRRGHGRSLLARIENVELRANRNKFRRAHCLVRESLVHVQVFLRQCGWTCTETAKRPFLFRKNCDYINEDGYLFERRLPDTANPLL